MKLVNICSIICTRIQNFIAPPRCNGCSSLLVSRALLCIPCNQQIIPVITIKISITKSFEVSVFAAGAYKDTLKRLICAKHKGYQPAGTYLGELIWHRTPITTMHFDYILSIPLHWTRKFIRGFNQTDEIASALSRMSGKPIVPLLQRVKRTQFQTSLAAADRLDNISDAFVLTKNSSSYTGKHLILVDDLMTTGATLRAACRELMKLKPASITCFVAARTV